MTTSAPIDQVKEAQKLTADALVDLYEVLLTDGVTRLRFRDGPQTTWQGNTYDSMGARLSGLSQNSDGSKSRPLLTVVNPAGIWNSFVHSGLVEGAQVTMRRVLAAYIVQNINIYDFQLYYIARVKEMIKNQGVTFELRSLSDGPDVKIPARIYIPPDFPFVTL